jgi:hypothetical protein
MDVWGNAEDGWDINDYYSQGKVEIKDDASDDEILDILTEEGYIKDKPAFQVVNSDESMISIDMVSDGYPAFELRKEE